MKEKVQELIKKYEEILNDKNQMIEVYENFGDIEMRNSYLDSIFIYERVIKDLKGIIK